MKTKRRSLRFIILLFVVLIPLFIISCAPSPYRIRKTQNFNYDQFKTVVVVPMIRVNGIYHRNLIQAEKKLSDYVAKFFKGKPARVIPASKVREDMNIRGTIDIPEINQIAARYGGDCIFNFKLQDILTPILSGHGVYKGYPRCNVTLQILNRNGELLAEVTGFKLYEENESKRWLHTYVKEKLNELDPELKFLFTQEKRNKKKS